MGNMIEIFKGAVARRNTYDPDTLIQKARIESDGGTVINLALMDGSIKILKSLGIYGNAKLLTDANWGVKKDGSGAVSKLYDISGNNNDAIQATGASQPIWSLVGGKGVITYSNKYLTIPFINLSTLSYTILSKVNPSSTNVGTIIGDWRTPYVFRLYISAGISYQVRNSSAVDLFTSPSNVVISSNVNQQIGVIWERGIKKYSSYYNGSFVDTITSVLSDVNMVTDIGGTIQIGVKLDNFTYYSGQINSSTIFNIALTPTQITTLYNAGL